VVLKNYQKKDMEMRGLLGLVKRIAEKYCMVLGKEVKRDLRVWPC